MTLVDPLLPLDLPPPLEAKKLQWTPKGMAARLKFSPKSTERGQGRGRGRSNIRIFKNGGKGEEATAMAVRATEISSAASDLFDMRQLVLAGQIFLPFLVASLGMVAAGILLSEVKDWEVFVEVSEMLILVPALLGLKGNLEMTLASRLSTHANLGDLDGSGPGVRLIVVSNLAAVQCQAICVGALASLVAAFFNVTTIGIFHVGKFMVMLCSAITAASMASLVLAVAMIGIVLVARKVGVDPDNVAGPIAGMLGDFCTLSILALLANGYWEIHDEHEWVLCLVLVGYACLAPVMAWVATGHPSTTQVLVEGWKPVIVSMCISSLGGVILRHACARFRYIANFAPVMNGAGGNLAAVQSARLSTDLHAHGKMGVMPTTLSPLSRGGSPLSRGEGAQQVDDDLLEVEEEPLTPRGTFGALLSRTNDHAATARLLIGLAIPGAMLMVCLIALIKSRGAHMPEAAFLFFYVCATVVQVCCLLVFAHGLVGSLWIGSVNPDNAAIPYVTSLGDVVGTLCLALVFLVSSSLVDVAPFEGAVVLQSEWHHMHPHAPPTTPLHPN